MTLLYTDPLFLRHETGRHPERPERLRAVTARLAKSGVAGRCVPGEYQPLTEDEVNGAARPRRWYDWPARGRTRRRPSRRRYAGQSRILQRRAGGGRRLRVGGGRRDARERPQRLVPGAAARPSRHADAQHGLLPVQQHRPGRPARPPAHGLTRILIVDWDVHHGNGTQDIFYADPEVHFFSIHRYGHGFYPGTGAADETGTGAGLGRTLNVPLRFGISRKEYLAAFAAGLEKAADAIKPELVLLSAGFDAHAADPIGSLGLEVEDFAEMTRMILNAARTHCRRPVGELSGRRLRPGGAGRVGRGASQGIARRPPLRIGAIVASFTAASRPFR